MLQQKAVLNVSFHLKKKFPFFFSAKLTTYSKALEIAAGFEGINFLFSWAIRLFPRRKRPKIN